VECPQCDAEIGQDSIFCPKCGERLQGLGAESFAELREGADKTDPVGSPAGREEPIVASASAGTRNPAKSSQSAAVEQTGTTLGDNVTLWSGRYAMKGMIDRLVLSGFISIAILILPIWWSWGRVEWLIVGCLLAVLWGYQLAMYVGRRLGHRYRLTPQTFFHERGLLVKSTSPIEIIRIDDITMKQTPLERLVGVGTIRILSSDTTDPLLVLKGIPNVRHAFETIDQARRAERRRRALRIDAV
jgi:membrane protein YdbS with pleckstrin-like domain